MSRWIQVWSEDYGETFIRADEVVMFHEDEQGFAHVKLRNGVDVCTSCDIKELADMFLKKPYEALSCSSNH
jgi:hypothetical protein